jgi:C-terminal processing protease CtpA/Prc
MSAKRLSSLAIVGCLISVGTDAYAWLTGSVPVPVLVAMAAATTEGCGDWYPDLRVPLAKAHASWRETNAATIRPIETEQGYRELFDEMLADAKKQKQGPERGVCELMVSAFYNNAWPLSENASNTELGVVGMEVGIPPGDDFPRVIKTLDGFDAKTQGVQAGDRIIAINQVSTKGLEMIEVTGRLRGLAGTRASVTIKRDGSEAPITYQITRRPWQ